MVPKLRLLVLAAYMPGLLALTAGANPASAQNEVTCRGKAATIVGTDQDDVIKGTRESDVIVSLQGADRVRARAGDDIVCGLGSSDMLLGGRGDDMLDGGDEDDVLSGGPGADTLAGMLGDDLASYRHSTGPVEVRLYEGTATGAGDDDLTSTESILGSPFGDSITGDDSPNRLLGGAGDDQIRDLDDAGSFYQAGVIVGGPGDDDLSGQVISYATSRGRVTVDMEEGTASGDGHDRIYVLTALVGSSFDDHVFGTDSFSDLIVAGGGNDTISGRGGDDRIFGDGGPLGFPSLEPAVAGDDVLAGNDGDDSVHGGRGDDIATGGSGNDVVEEKGGSDILYGGEGTDLVDYDENVDSINLAEGRASSGSETDTLGGFENVDCHTAEVVVGDHQANVIDSFRFIDQIYGGGGDDVLLGREGASVIRGEEGDDVINMFGSLAGFSPGGDNTLSGGPGDDFIEGRFFDHAEGGEGRDIIDFEGGRAVRADLALGTVFQGSSDRPSLDGTLASFEEVRGTAFADEIYGSEKAEVILGGRDVGPDYSIDFGADILEGRGGDDALSGYAGDDRLDGGAGRDALDGGAGRDVCLNGELLTGCES